MGTHTRRTGGEGDSIYEPRDTQVWDIDPRRVRGAESPTLREPIEREATSPNENR